MVELLTTAPQGESTLIKFFAQMANELDPVGKTMVNSAARSLMERGWLPSVKNFLETMSEDFPAQLLPEVLKDMQRRRLFAFDDKGERITSFLGSISLRRTPHRAELDPGNFLFTFGGLDVLSLGPIFGKNVECHTLCGQTGEEIELKIVDEQIVEASHVGLAGFAATWDGKAPLEEVAANSPLFANDAALEAWMAANPGIDGLPMSGDLLLFVGMGMMRELGDVKHRCIAFE